MINRCIKANVSSYIFPQSGSNSVAWVKSQHRLKIVDLACKPYGLVGFLRPKAKMLARDPREKIRI